jgi:hypothetical protein
MILRVKFSAHTQHALPGDDDLFGLFFDWQRTDQCCNFFGCLPLSQLPKTLLTSPHACVNDFEEQLPRSGVENEDGTV